MSTRNAISAKARAMFGERLKASDYATLLQKKTVGEIASYLKSSTMFRECLEGINEKSIHRGQLEVLLRTDVFERLAKLLRYADDNAMHFATSVVMESEIELIMMAVRSLENGVSHAERREIIARMPLYAKEYTSFDIVKLADVQTYDDIVILLSGTAYEKTIRRYQSKNLDEIDYVGLMHELRMRYYEACTAAIQKYGARNARDQMQEIINARIELENISIIYRLKKYFQAPPQQIRPLIVQTTCYFSLREINDMIDNATADQLIDRLHASKYRRYISSTKFTYIEHYTKQISYNMNYHFIETYTAPNLVMMSYLLLSDIEIQNVVDIIEAVRYGISQEHIRALLVY